MIRPSLFVVSHNQSMTSSLSKYFGAVGSAFIKHDFNPKSHSLTYSCIEEIHDFLSKNEPDVLLNGAVIFDYTDGLSLTRTENLDPTAQGDSKGSILAQLILAYPEVYWIIIGTDQNDPSAYDSTPFVPNWDDPRNVHWEEHFVNVRNIGDCFERLQRHQNGYRTIFDPSRIRTAIKIKVLNKHKTDRETEIKRESRDIFKRRLIYCSAALDEELAYTFLNGYTAYRFGYRCYTVTSKAEMKKLSESKQTVDIALEDLQLKFADMTDEDDPLMNGGSNTNASDALITRRGHYEFLPEINSNRIIITGTQDQLEHFPNVCKKPFSGMFDLHEVIKETDFFRKVDGEKSWWKRFCLRIENKSISIKRLGFWSQLLLSRLLSEFRKLIEWVKKIKQTPNAQPDNHSATNKIITLSEILLERSRKIAQNADTCPKAIYSALLALEGKELLYGRTMTTSLEMVAMQHKMEVTAECSFLGIGAQIKVKERASELACTVDKILQIEKKRLPTSDQLAQSYNAQSEMISNMRLIYKEYEQFDEEDFCIQRIRQLLQGLHFYSDFDSVKKILKRWWYLFGEKYFNWLMSSGANILWAIFFWIACFTICFMAINGSYKFGFNPAGCDVFLRNMLDSFFRSAETFFSIQPFDNNIIPQIVNDLKGWKFHTVSLIEMIFGYFHLGIFIAWIYQKLARR